MMVLDNEKVFLDGLSQTSSETVLVENTETVLLNTLSILHLTKEQYLQGKKIFTDYLANSSPYFFDDLVKFFRECNIATDHQCTIILQRLEGDFSFEDQIGYIIRLGQRGRSGLFLIFNPSKETIIMYLNQKETQNIEYRRNRGRPGDYDYIGKLSYLVPNVPSLYSLFQLPEVRSIVIDWYLTYISEGMISTYRYSIDTIIDLSPIEKQNIIKKGFIQCIISCEGDKYIAVYERLKEELMFVGFSNEDGIEIAKEILKSRVFNGFLDTESKRYPKNTKRIRYFIETLKIFFPESELNEIIASYIPIYLGGAIELDKLFYNFILKEFGLPKAQSDTILSEYFKQHPEDKFFKNHAYEGVYKSTIIDDELFEQLKQDPIALENRTKLYLTRLGQLIGIDFFKFIADDKNINQMPEIANFDFKNIKKLNDTSILRYRHQGCYETIHEMRTYVKQYKSYVNYIMFGPSGKDFFLPVKDLQLLDILGLDPVIYMELYDTIGYYSLSEILNKKDFLKPNEKDFLISFSVFCLGDKYSNKMNDFCSTYPNIFTTTLFSEIDNALELKMSQNLKKVYPQLFLDNTINRLPKSKEFIQKTKDKIYEYMIDDLGNQGRSRHNNRETNYTLRGRFSVSEYQLFIKKIIVERISLDSIQTDAAKKRYIYRFIDIFYTHAFLLQDTIFRTMILKQVNQFLQTSADNNEIQYQECRSLQTLENLFPSTYLTKSIYSHPQFYDNVHDNLLFVDKINQQSSENKQLLVTLVLKNILHLGMDNEEFLLDLNQYLGYFDIQQYITTHGEVPITSRDTFVRESLIQKHNIRIPETCEDHARYVFETLIKAPGVDVMFIKSMITEYTQFHYEITSQVYEKASSIHLFVENLNNIGPQDKVYIEGYSYTTVSKLMKIVGGNLNDENYFIQFVKDNGKLILIHSPNMIQEITKQNHNNDNGDIELQGNEINEHEDDEYEDEGGFQGSEYYASDDMLVFRKKLVNIIHGVDRIDERQIIQPKSIIVPFDPLYKIVSSAIGIHDINKETLIYTNLVSSDPNLNNIVQQYMYTMEELKTNLKTIRDEKIKQFSDKTDFYIAQYVKDLNKQACLEYTKNGKIKAIKLTGISEYSFAPEQVSIIQKSLQGFIESHKLMILQSLRTLGAKVEKIEHDIELAHFGPLARTAKELFEQYPVVEGVSIQSHKQRVFEELDSVKIIESLGSQWFTLTQYILYLAYNNRSKQTNSNDLKNKIDPILNQKKYTANHQNTFLSYLNGKLLLDHDDEKKLRTIIEQQGLTNIGRSLKVEVLPKSDPKGWVCGDYTDCCMPFTSEKNIEYCTREDMAYFVISIIDKEGSEDLVTQSVLVAAGENGKDFTTLAIDNIEIAVRVENTGSKSIICSAYDYLAQWFPDKKIIIGTTYNDDGGAVTGGCRLISNNSKPLQGPMEYSDCFGKHNSYLFYSPRPEDNKFRYGYFGLQIDNFNGASSILTTKLSKQKRHDIQLILEKIGQGQDDGDGGLNFSDNYSTIMTTADKQYLGYIIAADYLTDEDDALVIEDIGFAEHLSEEEKKLILRDYFCEKNDINNICEHENFDTIVCNFQDFYLVQYIKELCPLKTVSQNS